MIGVFVTAFYSFRLLFMTFHGKPRWEANAAHADHGHEVKHESHAEEGHGAHDRHAGHDHAHDDHGHGHHGGPPHEGDAGTWSGPLIALAIPSVIIGASPSSRCCSAAASAIPSSSARSTTRCCTRSARVSATGCTSRCTRSRTRCSGSWLPACSPPGRCTSSGRTCPDVIDAKLKPLRWVLENKYCFDWFNENVLAAAQPRCSASLLEGRRPGHHRQIAVDGSANTIGFVCRHRAPRAERLPLFLCVLDGHRSRRDARLVP